MMSVAFKEGIKINPQALQEIIIASNNDIRQVRTSSGCVFVNNNYY